MRLYLASRNAPAAELLHQSASISTPSSSGTACARSWKPMKRHWSTKIRSSHVERIARKGDAWPEDRRGAPLADAAGAGGRHHPRIRR